MPSTISTSVSRDFASSTVMTPSLPTFCIAWAIILPILVSPLDEIVPTWATSADDPTFLARFSMSLTTAATAMSMPRLRSIGFMPAATDLAPSRMIEWASSVAVVVPSPAISLVLWATSRTIWAPMFSNLSSSSISLATVTPSLVMRGAPNDLSSTTLRPLGPSVTLTALLGMSTPRSMRSRASTPNLTSLADIFVFPEVELLLLILRSGLVRVSKDEAECLSPFETRPAGAPQGEGVQCGLRGLLLGGRDVGENAHDVALLHDQEILAVDLDLGTGPLAEQHAVADLEVDRDQLAIFVTAARSDRGDFPLGGLFLGGVGNDDAALGLFFGVDALDHNPVVKRTEFHA